MLDEPATDRLGGSKRVLLYSFKIGFPLLSVLETIFLRARSTLKTVKTALVTCGRDGWAMLEGLSDRGAQTSQK